MKPIKFKEANVVFGEDQPEYLPLPAYCADTKEGHAVTCWKLSFLERIRILFTGRVWLSQLTFRKPLQPIRPAVKKYEIFSRPPRKTIAQVFRDLIGAVKTFEDEIKKSFQEHKATEYVKRHILRFLIFLVALLTLVTLLTHRSDCPDCPDDKQTENINQEIESL